MPKKISIFKLKPTQFALGMAEVVEKAEALRELSKHDLKKFVKDNPITVVIAPNAEPYIIDGHHHTSACWMAGVREMRMHVVHDCAGQNLSYKAFWRKMQAHHWCHLFDKFGDGPRLPLYLPHDIRGMGDDPYRSLAWLVRKAGGYEHSNQPFAEFHWANFFRHQKVFKAEFDLNFPRATAVALRLARSPAARKLPGYLSSERRRGK